MNEKITEKDSEMFTKTEKTKRENLKKPGP